MSSKKIISLENANLLLINEKLNALMAQHNLSAVEQKPRLVKAVLRHKVLHFPQNVPFVAAVKNCGEQNVIFNLETSQTAVVPGISLSGETNIGDRFVVRGVAYKLKDTINGFKRYVPQSRA